MEFGKRWEERSPGSVWAAVLCATLIPLMTGFKSKAWLVLPLPHARFYPIALALKLMGLEIWTHCASHSGAEETATFKSPTTHCYKSIKPLLFTTQPSVSAAEHVNSCDQIAAQLTAFTCAPTVPISKGEILAQLCSMGSWLVTRTWLFWGSNGAPWSHTLYISLKGWGGRWTGRGSPGKGENYNLPSSSSPPVTKSHWLPQESRLAAGLSQDLVLLGLGGGVHGGSTGMAGCVLGCSLPQPHCTYGRETTFIFLPPKLQKGLYSRWNCM